MKIIEAEDQNTLGCGIGCGFMILCTGIAIALLAWAGRGFPKFWE